MSTVGGEFRSRRNAPRSMSDVDAWHGADFTTAGQRLRARREALGVPVEAIVRKTRMPRRTIERIEADDFDAIGADFYVRGFIKLYAEHLGMGLAPLIEAYETQIALNAMPAAEAVPDYFQARAEPARSLSPAQIFLLVVCAATLVVFMMSVQKQNGSHVVAKRPAITAPGTPATAHGPAADPDPFERGRGADAVGN